MSVRIAVVGTGIAGLASAHLLAARHEVTVYEAEARPGGHTHTQDVVVDGRPLSVDTGFIVLNRVNYPGFCRLLDRLGVDTQPSDMSFSVRDDRNGLEWKGSTLGSLFAQRRNLLRPRFLRMVREILRFNRDAPRLLEEEDRGLTLGEYLARERYSDRFVENYLVPMGAALWSMDPAAMGDFPAGTFVAFFANHGMLLLRGRPAWLTIRGGSRRYVERILEPVRDRLRLATPVLGVAREERGVRLDLPAGEVARPDAVVLACHSDQALRLLRDPSAAEREVLGAIPYQENDAVLHTDASVMPRSPRAWASWNWHVPKEPQGRATITYDLTRLQSLPGPTRLFLTLNRTAAIDPSRVLSRTTYHHPVFTVAGVAAQRRRDEVSGVRGTWYAGAWWGHGFHEDGVASAFAVARGLGVPVP